MGEAAAPLHVVATAGHVDHGKSSLILRLTGIDPDRLAEEKRRGLTIDLGFAWTTLPSGHEIGFVDVPGHERFIRNMLAGVGPVRLVLFVVAADEGWKPQSEEHLQIVDVLGAAGAVVALTKADLVDRQTLASREAEVVERLDGTRLAGSPVVPSSVVTGEGLEDLRRALDVMIAGAPEAESDGRPRQFVDRVFTIRGAGTVVTGTLTGGPIQLGQEAEILPAGHRARIRALQSHKRALDVARPVSRVAVNLAGTAKRELARGDALVLPGQWRPTRRADVLIRPVRTITHPLTSRGAFKFYAGSAERDARIRLHGGGELRPGQTAFATLTLSAPVVLDVHDPFVVREAGRQETVGGGIILDTDPPLRPRPDAAETLQRRLEAERSELPDLLVAERGYVRAADARVLTGVQAEAREVAAHRIGPWLVAGWYMDAVAGNVLERLRAHHTDHPLSPGAEVADVAKGVDDRLDPGLLEAMLDHMAREGRIVRDRTVIRTSDHRPSTEGRGDADRLVDAVRSTEPTPPTVKELVAAGYGLELIRAVSADGRLVRISPDLVLSPELVAKAERVVRERGRPPGITVSEFRQAIGTSRRFALPILEYFDATGLTRRQGDHRVLRG